MALVRVRSLFSHTAPTPTISTFFFFNDTATTEIYTLSLHDALPISARVLEAQAQVGITRANQLPSANVGADVFSQQKDRKSTRLNSSHQIISYAVFCLKKKKKKKKIRRILKNSHRS